MRLAGKALAITFVFVLGGCERTPTGPVTPEPGLSHDGLAGLRVTRLRIHGNDLYALTDSGLYRRGLAMPEATWEHLGSDHRPANDILTLTPSVLLLATQPDQPGEPSLVRSTDGGRSWHTYQRNFAPGDIWKEVRTLTALSGGAALAGGAAYVVARSTDGGASWTKVAGDWASGSLGVHAIEASAWNPELVYAGGETGFFQPFVLRSVDAGQTWTRLPLVLGGDNAVNAIHVGPGGLVILGTEGHIVQSVDGGESWEPVLSPDDYPYFMDFVSGAAAAELWVAGAVNMSGPQPLRLWRSTDAGMSWNAVDLGGDAKFGAQSLRRVSMGGRDVLFIGTGEGVYRFVP